MQRCRRSAVPSAPSRWVPAICTVLRALLATVVTVQEHVIGQADIAAAALKHTGVHVRGAEWAVDNHSVAVHVDLAGHVHHAERSEGELAPGVADLAIYVGRVGVDCGPGAGQAGGERDGLGGTGSQAQGDQGRGHVDPAALRTPDDENDRLASIVGEGVGEGTVGTNPRGGTGRDGVCAWEAGRGCQNGGIDRGEQIALGNTTKILGLAEDLYGWNILCGVHFHRGWLGLLLGVKLLMAMFEGGGDSLAGKVGG